MMLTELCLSFLPALFPVQDPRTPATLPAERTLGWIHVPDLARLRRALPRLPLLRVNQESGWSTLLEGFLGQQQLIERSRDWDRIFLPFDRGLDFVLLRSPGAAFGFENLILGQASRAVLLKKQDEDLRSLFFAGQKPRAELLYRQGTVEDTPARYDWYRHRKPVELATGIPALAVGRSDLCVLRAGRRTVLRVAGSFDETMIQDPPLADMAGLVGLLGRKGRRSFGQELGEERQGLLLSTGIEIRPWLGMVFEGAFPEGSLPLHRVLTTLSEEQGAFVEHVRFITGSAHTGKGAGKGNAGSSPSWLRKPGRDFATLPVVVSENCVAAVRFGMDLAAVRKQGPRSSVRKILGALFPEPEGAKAESPLDVEICWLGAIQGTTAPQPLILISGAPGEFDSQSAMRRLSTWIRDRLSPEHAVLEPRPYVRSSGIHYIKLVDYSEGYIGGLWARILLGGGYLSLGKLGDRIAIAANPKTLRMAQKKLAQGRTLARRNPAVAALRFPDAALGQGFVDFQALSRRWGALAERAAEFVAPVSVLLAQGGTIQQQISGLEAGLLPSLTQAFPLQTFEILARPDGFEVVSRGGGLFSPTQWALTCEGLFVLARIHALSRF